MDFKAIFKRKIIKWIVIVGIVFGAGFTLVSVGNNVISAILAVLMTQNQCNDAMDGSDTGDSAGAVGEWTKKGTQGYKNAQTAFSFLVTKENFSKAGAAGVIGIGGRESGMDPAAVNPSGGVAGFLQWSGWGSFINGSRITAGGFIKSGQKNTLTMTNELKLLDYELNHGWSSVKKQMQHVSSPAKAAEIWSANYEGVSLSDGQTKLGLIHANANKALDLFGNSVSSANLPDGLGDSGSDAGSCDVDDGYDVNGKWTWPFASIKGMPTFLSGGQFGVTHAVSRGRTDFHDGVDFSNGTNGIFMGAPVRAVTNGKVYKVGNAAYAGWYVWEKAGKYNIIYQEGFASRSSIKVKTGDTVKAGETIGKLDSGSGHIHLGITDKNISSPVENGYDHPNAWLNPANIIKQGMK